jgi:hypothetical protein
MAALDKRIERFVLCVRNDECADLDVRKVYPILSDPEAARQGYLRVLDEPGEDYLYPESYFVPVRLSSKAQKAVTMGG